MTNAETAFWYLVRDRQFYGYKFRRQHPIGPFIADFACEEPKLIVELDGGQHCENAADLRRTAYLEARGWKVLRFWNNEMLDNREGVAAVLLPELQRISPSPARTSSGRPLPLGEV